MALIRMIPLFLVIGLLHARHADAQTDRPVVFRDVSVLTMTGDGVIRSASVVVEDGIIRWVGSPGDAPVPRDAVVIDGRGRFLMPGLADMHVHMSTADIPLFLANGVTTVREMNGSVEHVALRDSIADGRRLGPRMFVASVLLAGEEQQWRHRLVPDAGAARRAAADAAESGMDALKAYDGLSRAVYAALLSSAEDLGMPVVGHIPADVGLDGVLAAGQRTIEHVEQITYATVGHSPDTTRIPGIAERIAATATWVTPTLAAQRILTQSRTPAYNALLSKPEVQYVDPGLVGWWRSLAAPEGASEPGPESPRSRRAARFYGFQRDLTRALYEAGVPLLVGTDTPNPLLVPGFSIHLELAALLEAGIPAVDVLRAATRDAARFVGQDGEWGVVAPGAAADLVLVDRDPLDDLSALEHPVGVMVRGRWLDAAALEQLIETR